MNPLKQIDRDTQHFDEEITSLEERYRYFRAAFDSSPFGHIIVDTEGIVQAINQIARTLLDISEVPISGKPLSILLPDLEDREDLTPLDQPVNIEVTLQHGDHPAILVRLSSAPMTDRAGRSIGYHYTFHDITAQKQAENALRESESRYRTLVNQSQDTVFQVNVDGTVALASPACYDMSGYRPQEFLEDPDLIAQIIHPDYQEQYEDFWRYYHRNKVFPEGTLEWALIRKDGSILYTENVTANIVDEGGNVVGFQTVARDITRRKLIEAEREELLATLKYRSEYLETAVEVSNAVSSILDPDALIQKVASLVKERFALYYVGLFLVDQTGAWTSEPGEWAVLKAGTGEPGQIMVEAEHKLKINDNSMIGWCIANRQPRIALDAQEETFRFPNPLLPDTQSELALPLISRGEAIGALTVQSREKEAFSADDIAQLQTMTDQVANAIANAQLYEKAQREIAERQRIEQRLRRQTQELALINQASRALTSTLDLDLVLITFLEEIRHLMGVAAASVWLRDPDSNDLICRQATGDQNSVVRGWRLAPGEGLAGWVAKEGRSLIVSDAQSDPRHFRGVGKKTGLPLHSILTIPLRTKQDVIGVLQIVDTKVDRFHDKDVKLLEPLASTAAIAIENAQLYKQAQRDAATKSLLLREANHRVKNTLTSIVGLLYAEKRHAGVEEHPTYQLILTDLISRIQGMAAVHSMLAASEWQPLPLSQLASRIIHSVLQTLPQGRHVTVDVTTSPILVTPDQARHLTLVINELTTNTVKHALAKNQHSHIKVEIALRGDRVLVTFRDDGPGYPEDVLKLERYDVGFSLIQKIVQRNLEGRLSLYNDDGAITQIEFQAKVHREG